jgi:hypothetical protein
MLDQRRASSPRPRRGALLASLLGSVLSLALAAGPALLLAAGGAADAAEDVLLPGRRPAGPTSLAEHGAAELARLPWKPLVVVANLSAERPVAVAGAYLMQSDLVCVTATGLVYCVSRGDLQPRWVSSLKHRLVQPPAEGPGHYAFVVQGPDGAFWLQVFHKRNGADVDGFPVRLPFAVTSGPALDGGEVFVGSLGSVNDAKTVVSYGLLGARQNWGYRTRGLLWAAPVFDPTYGLLILASEDGRTTAIRNEGRAEAWMSEVTGAVNVTPVVTPAHVLVGAQDGTLHCFDLGSGERKWIQGLGAPIHGRDRLWVIGRTVSERRSTGVEGAAEVEVRSFRGIAFARNQNGLFAYVLETGTPLFQEQRPGAKPVGRHGRWVLTADSERRVLLRDAQAGHAVKGEMQLRMFDLLPTNTTDGAVYGVTHDGAIVAAVPR